MLAINNFIKSPSKWCSVVIRYYASYDRFALHKQAKMMSKIMSSGKKNNKPITEGEAMLYPVSSPKNTLKSGTGASRRYAVYNTVLMRHVTDVLSSGEMSDEISGKGIHVTDVRVANDFKSITVYWLATGASSEEKLRKVLPDVATKLRHQLSQLRVVGHVPKIIFVRDKAHEIHVEVENLLKTADFGEDYTPHHGHQNTTRYFSNENKMLADSQPSEDGVKSLPPMRNDILGLNHEFIMSKVKACVKKSYALHRISSNNVTSNNEQCTDTVLTTDTEREMNFAKFIIKKRISQKVKNKLLLSKKDDSEIHIMESNEVVNYDLKNKYDEEDYIEEFDEKYQK